VHGSASLLAISSTRLAEKVLLNSSESLFTADLLALPDPSEVSFKPGCALLTE